MTLEGKDLSIYLTTELMRVLGDPYWSSVAAVRRFSLNNSIISVDLEREREVVNFNCLVTSPLSLQPDDAFAFIEEVQRIAPIANVFSLDRTGNVVSIVPRIELTVSLADFKEDEKIPLFLETINDLIGDLRRIEGVVNKFRTKEVAYPEIAKLWKTVNTETKPAAKGRALERLFLRLLAIDGELGLIEHRLRTQSEEIDIVIQPQVNSLFWSKISPPMIVIECKNWRHKVGAKEVRDFAGKIENRPKLLCRIGFLVGMNGFTKDAQKELLGYRARDFIIATVTGGEIRRLVQTKARISTLLQRRITKAGFR